MESDEKCVICSGYYESNGQAFDIVEIPNDIVTKKQRLVIHDVEASTKNPEILSLRQVLLRCTSVVNDSKN